MNFNDAQGDYVDGMGGHTVDGAEFGSFTFEKEDAFTPAVTVSGLDLTPVAPETVQFDTVVTPEFPPAILGAAIAAAIGAAFLRIVVGARRY